MNYLALDYGSKRVGVAYKIGADPVVPTDIINYQGTDNLITQINKLVTDKNIQAIIIGLPLNLKGQKGYQAKIVVEFITALQAQVGIPIQTIDERFTSSMFSAIDNIDSYSAAEILSSYLSRLENTHD
ncbi:MAG: Holliday junction resolvase RuvX [Patescibacteria group bacterium]